MKLFKKIIIFLVIDWKTKLFLIEAFLLLGLARIIKSKSFSKVVLHLGDKDLETPLNIDKNNIKIIKQVSHSISIMSRYTFWESMCLVKAIAAMKMLQRRHIDSTLYLGVKKDKDGKMIAHAWLRSGPFYITGREEMRGFVVVSKFAKMAN